MFNVCFVLLWAISILYICYICAEYVNEELTCMQSIALAIIILIFGPAIVFSLIGIGIMELVCYNEDERKSKKIAVAQFKEIGNLDEMTRATTAAGIDWYYFDETADREFEIKDLKEHYDIVLEIKEL